MVKYLLLAKLQFINFILFLKNMNNSQQQQFQGLKQQQDDQYTASMQSSVMISNHSMTMTTPNSFVKKISKQNAMQNVGSPTGQKRQLINQNNQQLYESHKKNAQKAVFNINNAKQAQHFDTTVDSTDQSLYRKRISRNRLETLNHNLPKSGNPNSSILSNTTRHKQFDNSTHSRFQGLNPDFTNTYNTNNNFNDSIDFLQNQITSQNRRQNQPDFLSELGLERATDIQKDVYIETINSTMDAVKTQNQNIGAGLHFQKNQGNFQNLIGASSQPNKQLFEGFNSIHHSQTGIMPNVKVDRSSLNVAKSTNFGKQNLQLIGTYSPKIKQKQNYGLMSTTKSSKFGDQTERSFRYSSNQMQTKGQQLPKILSQINDQNKKTNLYYRQGFQNQGLEHMDVTTSTFSSQMLHSNQVYNIITDEFKQMPVGREQFNFPHLGRMNAAAKSHFTRSQKNNNLRDALKVSFANFKSPSGHKAHIMHKAMYTSQKLNSFRMNNPRPPIMDEVIHKEIDSAEREFKKKQAPQVDQQSIQKAKMMRVNSSMKSLTSTLITGKLQESMRHVIQSKVNKEHNNFDSANDKPNIIKNGSGISGTNLDLPINEGVSMSKSRIGTNNTKMSGPMPAEHSTELTHNTDNVTGLILENYLINKNFQQTMEMLQQLAIERGQNNILDQSIKEVAEECSVDVATLKQDLNKFIGKRAMIDASLNKTTENRRICAVSQKSIGFLKNTLSMNQKLNSSSLASFDNSFNVCECNHDKCEEDQHLIYLNEYKRFLKFSQALKERLRKEIPRDTIIASLCKDIQNIDDLTNQEIDLFSNTDAVTELLKNPLVEIIQSIKEINLKKQMEEKDKQENVQSQRRILDAKAKLMIKRSTNEVIDLMSKQIEQDNNQSNILDDEEDIDGIKKNLVRNIRSRAKAQRENFINVSMLIADAESREEQLIELDGNTEMAKKMKKQLQDKKLMNYLMLNKLHQVQKYQQKIVELSQNIPYRHQELVDLNELDEDQYIERKYAITGFDESISEKAWKFVEKNNESNKNKYQQKQQLLFMNDQKEDDGQSPHNHDKEAIHDSTHSLLESKQNIYNDIDVQQKFFQQAKSEVSGFNKDPNPESYFYKECQSNGLLPQPIFKCIKNNELRYQGKIMGMGYAKALQKFIQHNKRLDQHIIKLHLDDCTMKSAEFNCILQGIKNSSLGVSLQNITYSNNDLAIDSIRTICEYIEMSLRSASRCLKELCFSNVHVKHQKDLRELFQCLGENGQQITLFKMSRVNLNDNQIIDHLKEFLSDNLNLQQLQLSGCCLQSKHLLMISEKLRENTSLRHLDLSGNTVSELVDENQINQALFIQNIANFVSNSETIYNLNLSDLLLGKKLIFFIHMIKQNRSLVQLNLMNNLLTSGDVAYVKQILGMKSDTYIDNRNDMLQKYDMCFQQCFSKFKQNHMNKDNKNHNNKRDKIVSSIINTGIVKSLRENRYLQNKLNANNSIGEVYASTCQKSMHQEQSKKFSDQLNLRRYIGFNEFVFNELGQDPFEAINIDKPLLWQVNEDPNCDISISQYLLIYVNVDNLDHDFIEVKDQYTNDILRHKYGLNHIKSNIQMKSEIEFQENPIVFGTITNWRAYQMLKTYQFTSLLASQSNEEKKQILEYVFDEINFDFQKDFKNINQTVYPILNALTELQGAHVVGNVPQDSKKQKGSTQTVISAEPSFVYSKFVSPGKHSIFIYEPNMDKIFMKIIAVDVQENTVTRNIKNGIEDKVVNTDENLLKDRFDQQILLESYINDTQPGTFEIKSLFKQGSHKQLYSVLNTLYDNYNELLLLFNELSSENMKTYPLIEFEYLSEFCEKTGIVDLGISEDLQKYKENEKGDKPEAKELDEDSELNKLKNAFGMMNRAKFVRFLVWAYNKNNPQDCYKGFSDFIESIVVKFVQHTQVFTVRKEFILNKEIAELIDTNKDRIHLFYEKINRIYKLSPNEIYKLFIEDAKIPIQQYELVKFYVQSKQIVIDQQSDFQQQQINMSKQEFLEMIYRVTKYLFDKDTYKVEAEEVEVEEGEEESKPLSEGLKSPLAMVDEDDEINLDNVPKVLHELMGEDGTIVLQYKWVLQTLMTAHDENNILQDSSNEDHFKAEADKVGVMNYELIRFMDEKHVDEFLERV